MSERAASGNDQPLVTQRLVLRRFTAADVDLLVELDSDPAVMRYITGGRPTPRPEIEHDVLPFFVAYHERFAGYGYWAAHEKSSGDFVGWFHFRPAKGAPPDEPELGYRLRQTAWGKGYGTEGARALIDAGFSRHGVRRVVAEAMVVHVASRRVMEKAGLRLVRTFSQPWPDKIEGDEHGDVEYALDRADWEADVVRRIVAFLRDIGLGVEERTIEEATFLPGVLLERGRLVFDPQRLEYPGDLLHEAGHLAVAPRPVVGENGFNMSPYESAVLPWSYAAALTIGIDPAVVFHSGGYRGKSEGLVRTYGFGVYPGAHLLEEAGMCACGSRAEALGIPPYPHVTHWLRPDLSGATDR